MDEAELHAQSIPAKPSAFSSLHAFHAFRCPWMNGVVSGEDPRVNPDVVPQQPTLGGER